MDGVATYVATRLDALLDGFDRRIQVHSDVRLQQLADGAVPHLVVELVHCK